MFKSNIVKSLRNLVFVLALILVSTFTFDSVKLPSVSSSNYSINFTETVYADSSKNSSSGFNSGSYSGSEKKSSTKKESKKESNKSQSSSSYNTSSKQNNMSMYEFSSFIRFIKNYIFSKNIIYVFAGIAILIVIAKIKGNR